MCERQNQVGTCIPVQMGRKYTNITATTATALNQMILERRGRDAAGSVALVSVETGAPFRDLSAGAGVGSVSGLSAEIAS